MGIFLRLGPRSENTVEKKKKRVQPIIRGGKKLMIVKETLNFRRWLKFVNAFENYSEEIIGWISIAL